MGDGLHNFLMEWGWTPYFFKMESMEWGMDSMNWGMDSILFRMDSMKWGMDSMDWGMDSIFLYTFFSQVHT